MVGVSTTGMAVSLKTDLRFPVAGQQRHGCRIIQASISEWCREFSEECRMKAQANPEARDELELMKENLRLRRELEEAKKEKLFLSVVASITDRYITCVWQFVP